MESPPNKFGPWKVVGVIKEPNVYKVQIANRPKGGFYALKSEVDSGRYGEDGYLHFQKEIGVLKGLNHRNVIELVDYDLNPLNPYLVTPYYNLGSLDKVRVSKNWRRPIRKGIIRGYSYLHQRGIIKYDNNAKNIFLHQNGSGSIPRAIVGDFGGYTKTTDPDRICSTWMNVFRMFNKLDEL